MRILLFYFAELGGLGGVDVVVTTLAAQFRAAGHETGIVEVTQGPALRRLLPDRTPVFSVTAPSYPTFRRPRSWASFARTAAQFIAVCREFRPDIVNVHFPLIQAIPIVGAHALPHRWRLVATLHNSDIRVAPFRDPAIRPWQARLFARAEAITAVNQSLLDDALAMYPEILGKGHVILNGVGADWFQPVEDSNHQDYVLFAGRLSHVKGVDLLLKAWSKISPRFPQTRLQIAGDGEDRELLQSMASELGIADTVRFLGRRNQADLRHLYRHAKAVVLPSRREGLPLSLLEAGAAGAICVGSRTAGIPEIIEEGVTGYVVDAEAPEELSGGIAKTLTLTPAARMEMKQAAQTAIRRRFSEERMVSSYLHLFSSLVKDSRS
ncbi:MAG: glycosyltransferase family 4 protein [Actinomycetota bacterium]